MLFEDGSGRVQRQRTPGLAERLLSHSLGFHGPDYSLKPDTGRTLTDFLNAVQISTRPLLSLWSHP